VPVIEIPLWWGVEHHKGSRMYVKRSAFKHGITEADIRWAIDTVRIFHAMKCRNAFKHLLKNG